jgi:hypothetical protein
MRRALALISTIVFLSIFGWVLINRQWLHDVFIINSSDLQPQAAALKNNLNLTSSADFMYEASRPEVQPASQFNQSCANVQREQSIVLGCYTKQRFFVFDVDDARLAGVKEVTAAHELLHAAYERMSTKERQKIDKLLLSAANNIQDQRFKDTLAQYQRTEPDQIANELHSILGTEISDLPTELETHYSKYFKNRKAIVAYANQYESTFTSLENQIKQYDEQLIELKNTKEGLESRLQGLKVKIESDQQRLDSLRSSNNVAAYNQAVPEFNANVRLYNSLVTQLKQVVSEYNSIVEQRNTLATTQSDLVKELNSNFQTLK